jgi:hypothetical protein
VGLAKVDSLAWMASGNYGDGSAFLQTAEDAGNAIRKNGAA